MVQRRYVFSRSSLLHALTFQQASDDLYSFLQQNNIPSTHFFLGTNILQFPSEFTTAFSTLKSDIAVHTWTHP